MGYTLFRSAVQFSGHFSLLSGFKTIHAFLVRLKLVQLFRDSCPRSASITDSSPNG